MTEKLFYEDSHMITFCGIVTACEKKEDYYEAVLDRTAFFPEGGGQYADTGVIDGIEVFDVQEREGVIYHYVKEPLTVGKEVTGTIDYKERFSKMQNHSGEHIVSGLVHNLYGYDNVGFHMGKDAITMDFNGLLSKDDLSKIEYLANEAVTRNLDIEVLYPDDEELAEMTYRSKIEILGQVRIVVIPGIDVCACCAPHVKRTGEIGLIKLIGVQNYKGGVRVSMVCGFRALSDYQMKSDSTKKISNLLSAKETEIAEEVKRLQDEIGTLKFEIGELEKRLLCEKAKNIEGEQQVALTFDTELSGQQPRELVNLLLAKDCKVAGAFAGNETEGYQFVVGSRSVDVRPLAGMVKDKFAGRGGGRPEMIQGTLFGTEKEIGEAIKEWVENVLL